MNPAKMNVFNITVQPNGRVEICIKTPNGAQENFSFALPAPVREALRSTASTTYSDWPLDDGSANGWNWRTVPTVDAASLQQEEAISWEAEGWGDPYCGLDLVDADLWEPAEGSEQNGADWPAATTDGVGYACSGWSDYRDLTASWEQNGEEDFGETTNTGADEWPLDDGTQNGWSVQDVGWMGTTTMMVGSIEKEASGNEYAHSNVESGVEMEGNGGNAERMSFGTMPMTTDEW